LLICVCVCVCFVAVFRYEEMWGRSTFGYEDEEVIVDASQTMGRGRQRAAGEGKGEEVAQASKVGGGGGRKLCLAHPRPSDTKMKPQENLQNE
jgi:hypothetical protein